MRNVPPGIHVIASGSGIAAHPSQPSGQFRKRNHLSTLGFRKPTRPCKVMLDPEPSALYSAGCRHLQIRPIATGKEQPHVSVFDLRQWIADAEQAGELEHVSGASADLEIGAASQLNYRRTRPRALLFDDIPGYASGRRVLTSTLASPSLMGMSLGLGTGLSDADLVQALRGRPAAWTAGVAAYAATEVTAGPVLTNRLGKDEINFLDFPAPIWHEHDGGRYIGTGVAVVTVDPDTGAPNLGAYRIEVQDDGAAVSINIESGKHGFQHIRKWFEREGRAPVAASLGHHPVFLMVAGTEVPLGVSELDYAGAILGESVPYVRLPDTGLPVPAESELAFEGWLYPDRTRPEGPFGEWTGYYSGGQAP